MLQPRPEKKVPRLPPMKKVVMKMVFTRFVASGNCRRLLL